MEQLVRCPITGLQGHDITSLKGEYWYTIKSGEKEWRIILPVNYLDWQNDPFFSKNKHLVAGLLFNGQLFKSSAGYHHQLPLDYIKESFDEAVFPRTPQEKYDNLLQKLFELQDYEGAYIAMGARFQTPEFYYSLFFKNRDELVFYIKTLRNDGLLEVEFLGTNEEGVQHCRFTYKGLSYALKLMDEGKQSKNCFIAMSFSSEMVLIRNAIKEACFETGYTPVLVDEVHYDSDTTINDAIIANLRKSRFCIADFTEQKDGVYFESGFALGQGKQVIYSCREDYFKASHFDTNHFPHIVYKNADELKMRLIDKIEAWIK